MDGTPERITVELTPSQRDHVAWAADAMADFWMDHESRDEAPETNVEDPVQVTTTGCLIVPRADILDDLRYRLLEQLPDMGADLAQDELVGFRSQLAAAGRAYERIAAEVARHAGR